RHPLGVTRLYVLRSFEPERIFTFTFLQERIRSEVAQGHTALWYSLPQVHQVNGTWKETTPTPFEPKRINQATAELCTDDAPWPFKSWAAVAEISKLAATCVTEGVCDGACFRHQLLSETEDLEADWSNPTPKQHAPQIKLLEAYHALIAATKLE